MTRMTINRLMQIYDEIDSTITCTNEMETHKQKILTNLQLLVNTMQQHQIKTLKKEVAKW